jgi:hypothetical protein
MNSKILITKIKDVDIFFDTDSENFYYELPDRDRVSDRELYRVKRSLTEYLTNKFEGEFFIDVYNGIHKFKAETKFTSSYDNVEKVNGLEIDEYGNRKHETKEFEKLYPVNEFNQKLYDECHRLKKEGWALIHQGENLRGKLQKD